MGSLTTSANRPLNKYTTVVTVWQCPSDAGDANYAVSNCYYGYGNSYCAAHVFDIWRYIHTTSDTDPAQSQGALPITMTAISKSPANKFIQGDWEWENPGYNVNNPEAWWHNYKGQRRENMLYGDGHMGFFQFPPGIVNWLSVQASTQYLWW